MLTIQRAFAFCASLMAMAFVVLGPSIAQKPSKDPPVAISGFEYQFIASRKIHMNVCKRASCAVGSRVSYITGGPNPNPDFAAFKRNRKSINAALSARAPAGTTFNFGDPTRKKDKLFTLFVATREQSSPNRPTLFVKSTEMYSKNVTIHVISSSTVKEAVDVNSNLFVGALLVWSQR